MAPEKTPTGHGPSTVDRLRAVYGLDLELGMRNVAGNVELLERALRHFVVDSASSARLLANHSTSEERKQSLQSSHSLRGSCLSVGASELAALLEAFEAELRGQGNDIVLAALSTEVHRQVAMLTFQLEVVLSQPAR